jgi:hypothetical protein
LGGQFHSHRIGFNDGHGCGFNVYGWRFYLRGVSGLSSPLLFVVEDVVNSPRSHD